MFHLLIEVMKHLANLKYLPILTTEEGPDDDRGGRQGNTPNN